MNLNATFSCNKYKKKQLIIYFFSFLAAGCYTKKLATA